MTVPLTTRYKCGRCGHRDAAERMVFSRWTRSRYCQDINACAKRARRGARKQVAA